jgi:hypothetical protein
MQLNREGFKNSFFIRAASAKVRGSAKSRFMLLLRHKAKAQIFSGVSAPIGAAEIGYLPTTKHVFMLNPPAFSFYTTHKRN